MATTHKGLRLDQLTPEVQARFAAQIAREQANRPWLDVDYHVVTITVGFQPGPYQYNPGITSNLVPTRDLAKACVDQVKLQTKMPNARIQVLTYTTKEQQ